MSGGGLALEFDTMAGYPFFAVTGLAVYLFAYVVYEFVR